MWHLAPDLPADTTVFRWAGSSITRSGQALEDYPAAKLKSKPGGVRWQSSAVAGLGVKKLWVGSQRRTVMPYAASLGFKAQWLRWTAPGSSVQHGLACPALWGPQAASCWPSAIEAVASPLPLAAVAVWSCTVLPAAMPGHRLGFAYIWFPDLSPSLHVKHIACPPWPFATYPWDIDYIPDNFQVNQLISSWDSII